MQILSGKRCLLDTNILVAFSVPSHIHHAPADALVEKILRKEFYPVVSIQNLLEFSAVLVHGLKQDRRKVSADVRQFMTDSLLQVIYPDEGVLMQYLSLMKSGSPLHLTDLYLTATAMVYGVEVIITGDQAFEKARLKEISIYNPF